MTCAPTRRPRSALAAVAVAVAALLLVAGCGDGVEPEGGAGTATQPSAPAASAAPGEATTLTTATTPGEASTTAATGVDPAAGDDGVPPGRPPGDLGDDPALDALAQDCFAGDFSACDQLFYEGDADPPYEAYGDSCGGRNEPAGLCVDIYAQP